MWRVPRRTLETLELKFFRGKIQGHKFDGLTIFPWKNTRPQVWRVDRASHPKTFWGACLRQRLEKCVPGGAANRSKGSTGHATLEAVLHQAAQVSGGLKVQNLWSPNRCHLEQLGGGRPPFNAKIKTRGIRSLNLEPHCPWLCRYPAVQHAWQSPAPVSNELFTNKG